LHVYHVRCSSCQADASCLLLLLLLQIIGPLVSDMKDETHAKELAA
jgi:hypothetical protein